MTILDLVLKLEIFSLVIAGLSTVLLYIEATHGKSKWKMGLLALVLAFFLSLMVAGIWTLMRPH